jgi:hypothetical protein
MVKYLEPLIQQTVLSRLKSPKSASEHGLPPLHPHKSYSAHGFSKKGGSKPLRGDSKPLYGDSKPLYGDYKPRSGDSKPLYGDSKPRSGDSTRKSKHTVNRTRKR